jgi:transcription antitermination factor NusG
MSSVQRSIIANAFRSTLYAIAEAQPVCQKRWYAIYTCSRREKQVARIFTERRLESFLPLQIAIHRGTHGRKQVSLPLFPGYIFVHIGPQDRRRVLDVPGVVRVVSFQGQPAVVSDAEIDALQKVLASGRRVEPCTFAKIGHEAEILSGPFQGLRGKVLRRNNRCRVVLSVDLLHRSIAVDVDEDNIEFRPSRIAA